MLSTVRFGVSLLAVLQAKLVHGATSDDIVGNNTACYFPSGDLADLDIRCNNGTEHSMCCGPGSICWSNGVCSSVPENGIIDYVRASCTDQNWESSSCLQKCKGPAPNQFQNIWPCQGITTGDVYCCDPNGTLYDCCSKQETLFKLPVAEPIAIVGSTKMAVSLSLASPTATSLASTDSASTTTAGTGTVSPVAAGTETTPSSLSSAAPQPSSSSSSSGDTGTKIGVGVGVPLGVALLALGGFLLWRIRRSNQEVNELKQQMMQLSNDSSGAGGYKHPYAPITGQTGLVEANTQPPRSELAAHPPDSQQWRELEP